MTAFINVIKKRALLCVRTKLADAYRCLLLTIVYRVRSINLLSMCFVICFNIHVVSSNDTRKKLVIVHFTLDRDKRQHASQIGMYTQ